jgi:hypothetical protein
MILTSFYLLVTDESSLLFDYSQINKISRGLIKLSIYNNLLDVFD